MSHGGKREGAGRKSTGRQKEVFYITPEESRICKLIIEQVRLNQVSGNQKIVTQNISSNQIEEQTEFDFNALESNENYMKLVAENQSLKDKIMILKSRIEFSNPESNDLNLVSENQKLQHELSNIESTYENEICELKYQHENEIADLKTEFQIEVDELKEKHKEAINELRAEHKEEINELENKIESLSESQCEDVPEVESLSITPITIASNERIMALYKLNAGMKGIYKFIADTLNEKNELTPSRIQWTPDNIKKRIQKIKNQEVVS